MSRLLLVPSRRCAGAWGGSDEGGREELAECWPRRASSSRMRSRWATINAWAAAGAVGAGQDVQGYGLLESAQGLGDAIVSFLEEWATQTVPLDEDGRPLMYGTPGL